MTKEYQPMMPSFTYSLLVIAYAIVWLAIFSYVARLSREQRRLSRELENLRSKCQERTANPPRTESLPLEFNSILR